MIRFKRIGNHDMMLPSRAYGDSAAFDMRAAEPAVIYPGQTKLVPLGFAVGLDGHAALLLPRSGLGNKGLVLGNLVGLIDPSYTGELKASLWNRNTEGGPFCISYGDVVCQMLIINFVAPTITEVFDLEDTVRGSGGFGSSTQ
jgi:dUTP pyrophosphatase